MYLRREHSDDSVQAYVNENGTLPEVRCGADLRSGRQIASLLLSWPPPAQRYFMGLLFFGGPAPEEFVLSILCFLRNPSITHHRSQGAKGWRK